MLCPLCSRRLSRASTGERFCYECAYMEEPAPVPVVACNPHPPGLRGRALWQSWADMGGIGEEPVKVRPERDGGLECSEPRVYRRVMGPRGQREE